MRLFVAVHFPEALREAVWAETAALRATPARVKWVPPALMHVTLKFIGERGEAELEALERAVREGSRGEPPLRCRVGGVGAFPNFRRPRVVWVGVEDGGALARLATRIEAECAALGVDREARRFSPHLTLGRARDELSPADVAALRAAAEEVRGTHDARIEQVSLVHSTLGPAGPAYREIVSVPLHGGAI